MPHPATPSPARDTNPVAAGPRLLAALLAVLVGVPTASAAPPWHLPDWQARAVVAITRPATEADVDTAGVKVLCQGRGKADGSDYRVVGPDGKPVPFQVLFHDPARYSLIAFQAADPKAAYCVYFGNPKAERAAEEVVASDVPAAGPPKGVWVPRFGLVFETRERPHLATKLEDEPNPENLDDLKKVLAGSKRRYGARWQRGISDGFNPFGPSNFYVSVYRGWIRIPKDGTYRFCTASNEASFAYLDGKPLVEWPGRHTAERGIRGEVNRKHDLTAGLHYVEYYHEEVIGEQVAFLGWRPGADEGPFAAIPEAAFPAPHEAAVTAYESPKGPLATFEPAVADSVWADRPTVVQYTRCRFQAGKLADGTIYRWDFGDGQSATGPQAEHVYLTLGDFPVTLTTEGPAGKQTVAWPLAVFEIESETETFPKGDVKAYAKLTAGSDRTKLSAESLRELVGLLGEAGLPAEAAAAGEEYLRRFPTAPLGEAAAVRKLVGDAALKAGKPEDAAKHLRAALVPELALADRLDALASLVRAVGVERKNPDEVESLRKLLDAAVQGQRLGEPERKAYQRGLVAVGDAALWHGDPDAAREPYRQAERQRDLLAGQAFPANVRAARVGAFANSMREYLDARDYRAAADLVDGLEASFPTEKANGDTFFWRGKLLSLTGDAGAAARYLARAVTLAPGAKTEPEARWLLAAALEKLGKADAAREELRRLAGLGGNDSFVKQAREKLKP